MAEVKRSGQPLTVKNIEGGPTPSTKFKDLGIYGGSQGITGAQAAAVQREINEQAEIKRKGRGR